MRTRKWLSCIALFFLAVILYEIIVGIIFMRKIQMPIEMYSQLDYVNAFNKLQSDYDNYALPKSNSEYKDIIEEELRLKFYIYTEKEMKSKNAGATLIIIRTMILDSTLSGYEYCLVFTHEAMHFKRFSGNETYVCFETFKYLYENEDEDIHNIGVWYGLKQLIGKYSGEYNCHNYIINYLKEKI